MTSSVQEVADFQLERLQNHSKISDRGNITSLDSFTTTMRTKTTIMDPISDQFMVYFQLVSYAIVGQALCLYGLGSNAINIIVFVKLGVNDPMNTTLLGLSVSDFCTSLIGMWINICLTPGFWGNKGLPFTPNGAHYIFGYVPRYAFVKITSYLTMFIAVERCLCVTFPFKVKKVVTSKRILVLIVLTYTFVIASISPLFYIYRMGWVFLPDRNRTVYTLYVGGNAYRNELYSFVSFTNGTFVSIFSFVVVATSSLILVNHLKKSAQWRHNVSGRGEKTGANGASGHVSSKDTKAAKMVLLISALFIGCFTPNVLTSIVTTISKDFRIDGRHPNLVGVVYGCTMLFEAVNASFNLNFYYTMSTNYRAVFDGLFAGCGQRK